MELSKELKINSMKIRYLLLKMLKNTGYGHIGGSMSIVEALSVLYGKYLKVDPLHPDWNERDYFVLSKGHTGPGQYAALANFGFISIDILNTLNADGTSIPSHPSRLLTEGIDMSTGALGQGISAAVGIALGIKIKKSMQKVVCIVGDGELNEGQCWEAFQFANQFKLDNLVVLIDENKRQLDGFTKDIMKIADVDNAMKSFGFWVKRVDGSSEIDILNSLIESDSIRGKPKCIVLDTIKGQGIKYFENKLNNHSMNFNDQDIEVINRELDNVDLYLEQEGIKWQK